MPGRSGFFISDGPRPVGNKDSPVRPPPLALRELVGRDRQYRSIIETVSSQLDRLTPEAAYLSPRPVQTVKEQKDCTRIIPFCIAGTASTPISNRARQDVFGFTDLARFADAVRWTYPFFQCNAVAGQIKKRSGSCEYSIAPVVLDTGQLHGTL